MTSESSKNEGLGRYGEPATLILISLAEGPKHGYAIMVDVEKQMGVTIGPGTLYAAISKLLKQGFIRPLPSSDRARPYEITPSGREVMAAFLKTWAPIVKIGQARLA
ncbi:MAG TPA: PadR family transcriptional regulator [Fimbriimonas sp.]|nr:PadR family transcriptional regulator [Fimbriimonas sp.]